MQEDRTPTGHNNVALIGKKLKNKQKRRLTTFKARMDRLKEHHVKFFTRHREYEKAQTEPPGSPNEERESSSLSGPPTQQHAATVLECTESDCSAGTCILDSSCSDVHEDPEEPPLTRTDSVMLTKEHVEYISKVLDGSDAGAPSEDSMHESSSEQPEGPRSQVDVEEESTSEGMRRPTASPDEGPSGSRRRRPPYRDRDYDTSTVNKPHGWKRWSFDEVQAVEANLSHFLDSGILPRKVDCVACIKASSGVLRRRNW